LFDNHPALKPLTQHALCCKARDLEFWEAVGRVPFDQQKFRKFEPVIFVEWKAPKISLKKRKQKVLSLHSLLTKWALTCKGMTCLNRVASSIILRDSGAVSGGEEKIWAKNFFA